MSSLTVAKLLLLAAVFGLMIVGFVMVYSVTSVDLASAGENPFQDVFRQVVYALLGVVALLFFWHAVPYRSWLNRALWIYYGICMILLLATIFVGTEVNGARRWLYIGSVGIQPSEFIKIALLLMTIRIVYLHENGAMEFSAAGAWFIGAVLVPLLLIGYFQSDLGTSLITFVGIYAALWLGGVSKRSLLLIAVAVIVMAVVAILLVGYRSSRFVFINPWDDGEGGLGSGFNIIHSYYAIAGGGLFGTGIGGSHEKFSYLFAADSDFIFAIICEELGLVGAIVVIGLFLIILFSGLKIASEQPDSLGAMIAGACAIMLVFQAFLNIGCAIGVFPTTGKPLPFISSGGSSIISSSIIIGLILAVEKAEERSNDHERKRENLKVIRATDDGVGRTSRRPSFIDRY